VLTIPGPEGFGNRAPRVPAGPGPPPSPPDGSGRAHRSARPPGQTVAVDTYTFGDDRSARERLRLVAAAYEPVSRAFLGANVPDRVTAALDLGCGPGLSTRLLDEVCAPRTLVGIDSSADFVDAARAELPGARFETHDVTSVPLPGAPADVIYARLLLAHLSDPVTVARRWLGQLRPGGCLLIEDLDAVENAPGPLRHYEELSARTVRSGGGPMYAGALLAELGGETRPVTVPGALAARIYLFNVRHWLDTPGHAIDGDQLRELEAGLVDVTVDDHGGSVTWMVRQLVLRR